MDVEEGKLEEELVDEPGTTIDPNTVFTVFNEMWFLTVDPFVRISVFITKLSKR